MPYNIHLQLTVSTEIQVNAMSREHLARERQTLARLAPNIYTELQAIIQ